jgi:hypothetical protein
MDAIEKIIRPIVEGQIRGFLKEHPVIVEAVDWYKPRDDKAVTLTNSISKRIVRDLTCPTTRARLAVAFLACASEAPHHSTMASDCGEAGQHGTASVLAESSGSSEDLII